MQPLDFYHFFPLWYDLWVSRIAQAIQILKLEDMPYQEIKGILPGSSNFRTIIKKLIVAYRGHPARPADYKTVSNFLARMLQECCPNDPFAFKSNPVHSPAEVNELIKSVDWSVADKQSARLIGQLITSAGSMVHGLYNDVVTDFAWDAYGPYQADYSNEHHVYLIRHFKNLQPESLWEDKYLPSINELTIHTLYQGIVWEINFWGCHTISHGQSPVTAMKKLAVYANNNLLDLYNPLSLIDELSDRASKLYQRIRQMDLEELKLMVMRQECYQFKELMEKAGLDWQPNDEMIDRIKNKPLLKGIFPLDKFIESRKDFNEIFGIKKFEEEVISR